MLHLLLLEHIDAWKVAEETREHLRAVLTAADLDPRQISTAAAICQDEAGRRTLHVSEFASDSEGRRVLDYATNKAVTRPIVVPLSDEDAQQLLEVTSWATPSPPSPPT